MGSKIGVVIYLLWYFCPLFYVAIIGDVPMHQIMLAFIISASCFAFFRFRTCWARKEIKKHYAGISLSDDCDMIFPDVAHEDDIINQFWIWDFSKFIDENYFNGKERI